MNRTRLITVGLAGAAAVLLLLTFVQKENRPSSQAAPASAAAPGASASRPPARPPDADGVAKRTAKAAARPANAPAAAQKEDASAKAQAPAAASADSQKERAAEKAVAAWEALVDQLAEQTDAPTQERMESVKQAFDALDKGDQMDAIHTALNLVPDEQFASLYGIFFDKKESEDVLDAIFSDALNRPDELKNPLMKVLAKDREHPCFFEAARILDVIGELEGEDEKAESGPQP